MNIGQMLAHQKQVAEYENLRRVVDEMDRAQRQLREAQTSVKTPDKTGPK